MARRNKTSNRIHDKIDNSIKARTPVIIAPEQSPWESTTPASEEFVRAYIGSFSREPFQRQLAKFLQCAPDRKSIIAFAKRNPDKWAKTIQVFASLSGYTEKLEVDMNINIQSMSDTLLIDHVSTPQAGNKHQT